MPFQQKKKDCQKNALCPFPHNSPLMGLVASLLPPIHPVERCSTDSCTCGMALPACSCLDLQTSTADAAKTRALCRYRSMNVLSPVTQASCSTVLEVLPGRTRGRCLALQSCNRRSCIHCSEERLASSCMTSEGMPLVSHNQHNGHDAGIQGIQGAFTKQTRFKKRLKTLGGVRGNILHQSGPGVKIRTCSDPDSFRRWGTCVSCKGSAATK